jgi:PAS domain S-box-containing protein
VANPEEQTKLASLDERISFEELIANLSAKFVNLPATRVDQEIEDAQRRVCEHLGLDLSALWQSDPSDLTVMVLTHLYRPQGGPPLPSRMVATEYFPWCLNQLVSGKLINIPSCENAPTDALRDKEMWRHYGIKSNLCFPLRTGGGATFGAISFNAMQEECDWPEPVIRRLELVAEIIANALARKYSDERLRESEERLALAADSADAGLWSLDVDSDRFWATPKARVLFRFEPDIEITREGFLEFVHPEDRERIRRAVADSVREMTEVLVEYRIVHPDGNVRWILSRGRPHIRDNGTVDRLMGISIDITEQKQQQTELERACKEIGRLKEQLQRENLYLRHEAAAHDEARQIIGRSTAIRSVLDLAAQVAVTDSTVVIEGETGTGKELVARFIHSRSSRSNRLLVKVDCSALPATLIESELFGREKGAYTGAMTRQSGRFELADGSTIFLDEIGDLPLELQAKLLRLLEEGRFERLGSAKTISADVRVIAATNRDLAEEVRRGTFRQDLYYRLNVFPLHVPPLRERPEDIPLLMQSFIDEFGAKFGRSFKPLEQSVMQRLQDYPWPGNVRELRNIVERAVIISSAEILNLTVPEIDEDRNSLSTLAQAEASHIRAALKRAGGRIKGSDGAASILGMKPSTLYTRMKKLGISPGDHRN